MSIDISAVVAHYIDTLLWSESCRGTAPDEVCDHLGMIGDERVDCDKSLVYLNYGPDDLAPEARKEIESDVRDFVQANAADLDGMDPTDIGHNFLLTRNHHGTGFWDRGLGERGDRLTAAAHPYGEMSAYVGDDGKVYVGG